MASIGETFRNLHVPGSPLVMINVWDQGTAKMMAALGAKALATSSAAHAYLLGKPDGGDISRDDALAHAQEIVSATALPVQGDFENGFGDDPDTCAETVRLSAEIGLAGICIEDTMFPSGDAYAFDLTVERIKAAVSAARTLPQDFVLTARADGVLMGSYDTDEALRRLQAFEVVGADCLYAPLLPDIDAVRRVTSAVSNQAVSVSLCLAHSDNALCYIGGRKPTLMQVHLQQAKFPAKWIFRRGQLDDLLTS